MTSPGRSRDGLGGEISPAILKGAVLIFVALVLGVFLLSHGVDTNTTGAVPGGGTTPTTTGGTGDTSGSTTVPASTTTVSGKARAPAEVTVLVANASGIPQAATKVSDQLQEKGYVTTEPANAAQPTSTTSVYYVGSDQAEALAVAGVLGVDTDSVAEMPDPAPVSDLRGATVLVVLGPDKVPSA